MRNLITVYITNRNYSKYLNQSIQSVINQEYKDIFLVIIDDASTDNSKKILKKYKENKLIKIIHNKTKKGLIKCANIAIKAAKGKYILRLDADDYLRSNAIKILQKKIVNNIKVKMVFSNFFRINENNKVLYKHAYRHKKNYSIKDTPAHGACSLIDLNFLRKIGGYNEKFDRQDGYYLWLSILLKKKSIIHSTQPLFFYRKHKNNLSKNKKKILKTRIKILNYFLNKFFKKKKDIVDLKQATEIQIKKIL
jgi:5-hydroxyisourate hydrolase-like protein (transthyretin family)